MRLAHILPLASLVVLSACGAEEPATAASDASPTMASTTDAHAAPAKAAAKAEVGKAAPDFTLKDLTGSEHTLSSYKGKTVVLEWFNPGCPFVVTAHEEGGLKTLAADHSSESTVWLAINSGAPGKQGHGVEANKAAATSWKLSHPILIDESGAVGHTYNATNTPQMVVVDPKGVIAYAGALDNSPRNVTPDGQTYTNYVTKALGALAAGEPVKPSQTNPYGCSVKY